MIPSELKTYKEQSFDHLRGLDGSLQDMRRSLKDQPEGVPTLLLVRRNGRSRYVAVRS
jgi:hypothetical protein